MSKTVCWQDAKWIGSPNLPLDAARKGVFGLEAVLSGCGGIVFGAGDRRLSTIRRNVQNQSNDENYISYYLDVSASPKLVITRVGYAEGDTADMPLVTTEIAPSLLRQKNTLTIQVLGNTAAAFLNGKLIDGEKKQHFFYVTPQLIGRQLNPLGDNDVITFPRLNKVGLVTGGQYNSFRIFNLRPPVADLYKADGEKCLALVGKIVDPSHGGVTLLKREFEIGKEVKHAAAYITARGDYTGLVNGRALNVDGTDTGPRPKDYFTPGAAHFDKHIFYHCYDVTRYMQQGENCLEFTVASGWWSDAQNFYLRKYNFWGDNPSLCMKLEISYTDGTTETVITDEDWLCSNDGPVRYASHFHGETYDARLENAPKTWQPAVVITPVEIKDGGVFINAVDLNTTSPEILEYIGNPVGEVLTIKAQSVTAVGDVYIYDMGQNMVGVPRVKVKGAAGQEITLRFSEVVYLNLPQYGNLQGYLMTENLRDADCTDIYICKGDPNGEIIFPSLTFHGYRYMEISGLGAPPPLEDVDGVVLSSITEDIRTGSFECSNPLVNKLFENILWSQRANFLSIPTDCPQRNERMGWMGDAQVFVETSVYNANVLPFFERFLISVRDLQREDGRFPDIAPQDSGFGGIPWGSAGVIMPWVLYRQYGEKRVLEDNYAAMCKYVNYLRNNSTDNLLNPGIISLGDWLAADPTTDNDLIWNAIIAYDVRITADTAKILGDMDTYKELEAYYNAVKATWNKTFVCPANGKTRAKSGEINDTQTSYALPLYYGIFENPAQAAKLLNHKTIALDYRLTTGFLGTPGIAAALSDHGYADTAYRLLTQTEYPSWLYPITQGATSIWERWDSQTHENGFGSNNNMNSFNHYSLGAVGAWLYSRVLGIRPGTESGYKSFVIQPCFGGLSWAKGHYDTMYGRISVCWERVDGGYLLKFEVPAGATAEVILPGGSRMYDGGVYELNVPAKGEFL